jgi:hypothetical protein
MLMFKKKFLASIAAGTKTTTLRYWRSPRVRPGSVHAVPGLGRVRIESVEPIPAGSLRRRHALADGFATLRALRAALRELYGQPARGDSRRLYLVRFTVL